MTRWTWTEDRRYVEIGKRRFAVDEAKRADVGELALQLQLDSQVHQILRVARLSYESGRADYENAGEQLRHLIGEVAEAEAQLAARMQGIGRFFVPPGLAEMFRPDGEEIKRFVQEAIPLLSRGPEPAKLKNEPPVAAQAARAQEVATPLAQLPQDASGANGTMQTPAPAVPTAGAPSGEAVSAPETRTSER